MIEMTTRQNIIDSVGALLQTFLSRFDSTDEIYLKQSSKDAGQRGELKPFHEALLTPAISNVSRFERSFSTTLGSMFEVAAELIGRQNFSVSRRGMVIEGGVSSTANTAIESIRSEVERNGMGARYLEYVESVVTAFRGDVATRSIKVDLYLKDSEDRELFFEMKSPKPNKDQCLGVTEKLLRIHAIRQEGPPNVRTFYAMSYNPYGISEQYRHSFSTRLLDMQNQVLLGDEFWELIGGEGTGKEVKEIFGDIGLMQRSRVLRVLGI